MMKRTAESALAGFVAEHDRSWSPRAVELAEAAINDTLAIGIAGMHEEQVAMARRTLLPSEHAEAVPTWTAGERFAVGDAAFLLGVACHSLDWDDYMHPMHGHCSAVLLPTVWTLGEQLNASGEDIVDAFLVGYQVDFLVSQVLGHSHYRHGWHATSTAGTIGAAAAAARLLGLNTAAAGHALAIAASQAGGIRANFGTSTKAMHAGFAARHGVQSAQLAQAGVQGSPEWLLGEHGMRQVFVGDRDGEHASAALLDALAGPHGIETEWGLVQKPYCCCGSCHSAVEALIDIVNEHDLTGDEIERIEMHVDPMITAIMQVDRPHDQYSSRYSPTWVMAVSAIDRAAGPAQFAVEALDRAEVHRLRDRVTVHEDLETVDDDRFAGRIVVHARGDRFEQEHRHASGHPRRPFDSSHRTAKQGEALHAAVGPRAHELGSALAGLRAAPSLTALGELIRTSMRR